MVNVPLDRITAEANEIHIGRLLLTLIAGFFYGLGWIAAKTFIAVGFMLSWSIAAVKVGWKDARSQSTLRRRN